MNDLKIYITIGGGQALGINNQDQLVLIESKKRVITNYVSLGKVTKDRIRVLVDTLESLKIHAKE